MFGFRPLAGQHRGGDRGTSESAGAYSHRSPRGSSVVDGAQSLEGWTELIAQLIVLHVQGRDPLAEFDTRPGLTVEWPVVSMAGGGHEASLPPHMEVFGSCSRVPTSMSGTIRPGWVSRFEGGPSCALIAYSADLCR